MNRELIVYVDMSAQPIRCGRLWARSAPRESASFEYDADWIVRRDAFALDPELPLARGQFHTAAPLFRAFTDPAPDRWGQTLMRRAERMQAKHEGRKARTLGASDFLAQVDDRTRLGALRIRDATHGSDAPFLAAMERPIPPLIHLARLLAATGRIVAERETDEDLTFVLAPGTSLGGARPKASVLGRGDALWIAKFPRKDDEWPVTRWEATTLALAKAAGIRVPAFRLELVSKKAVLLIERFDRDGKHRIPFMSAMTALSANDNEAHSYLEIVDAIRREGATVTADLRELFRRLVFNVLVSNGDDHLRNHGLLRNSRGWSLAPAYDLNPMPPDVRPRVQALAIDERDATSSMETVFAVAAAFGIDAKEAKRIAREVAKAVKGWRAAARTLGLSSRDLARMEAAFEHEDLELAASAR